MNKHLPVLFSLALLGTACAAHAQEVTRTPLPEGHPLIGVWRVDVPGTQCHEVYTIKSNGTMSVTSAEQAAESEFQIDLQPSAKGFYKWVDKITQDNGKAFVMCQAEDLSACFGPFRRVGEGT